MSVWDLKSEGIAAGWVQSSCKGHNSDGLGAGQLKAWERKSLNRISFRKEAVRYCVICVAGMSEHSTPSIKTNAALKYYYQAKKPGFSGCVRRRDGRIFVHTPPQVVGYHRNDQRYQICVATQEKPRSGREILKCLQKSIENIRDGTCDAYSGCRSRARYCFLAPEPGSFCHS